MTKLFVFLFLSLCLMAQFCFSAELKRFFNRNVCSYRKEKVFYKMKWTRVSRHCYTVPKLCDKPDYPFLICKEVRCKSTAKWFPRKYIKYVRKTECCPGWSSHWKNRVALFYRGCTEHTSCITLPQYTPKPCSKERRTKLIVNRRIYRLTTPPKDVPDISSNASSIVDFLLFPILNLPSKKVVGLSLASPIEKNWTVVYLGMGRRNRQIANQALQPQNFRFFYNYSDYANLLDSFRKLQHTGGPFDKYISYPSQEEDFKDIIGSEVWQEDKIFVEQRLAGLNPMVLKKLKFRDYLVKRSHFSPALDSAMARATGLKTNMLKMVRKGLVYVVEYPLLRNLTNAPDVLDLNPKDSRVMRKSTSPVGIFVSVENCVTKKYELKPVAIQMDFHASSPVFSPTDGSKWLNAKEEFQRADITHSQLIEHLLKTHLLMEPICVTIKRTLSEFHPLYEVLKWHCRGTFVTNSLGLPNLLSEKGFMHNLSALGNVGATELVNKGFLKRSWGDTDFENNLKKRGVFDAEKLPYFPYRDDGMIIWRLIRGFATEYVDMYYHNKRFVTDDKELQNFANELSPEGVGPNGGSGMVDGFPRKISTKEKLADVVARILFVPIQHHAMNYPVVYYGGFVPNMPMKLYDDPRVPLDEFSVYSLPQSHIATIQVTLSMSLGSLRYDKLFDYGSEMKDKKAGNLVTKYYKQLMGPLQKFLRRRNKQRLQDGHLTYPYYLPGLMPNSIHT